MMRWMCAAAMVLVCVLGSGAAALAQDGNYASPTEDQLELYKAGADAFGQEDWSGAVEFFEASLAIGELNITYLNMGRALQRAGRCADAKAAYDKVASAPQIREPSPVQVLTKLKEFRKELESCVEDKPVEPTLPDPGNLAPAKPGKHRLLIQPLAGNGEFQVSVTTSKGARLKCPQLVRPNQPCTFDDLPPGGATLNIAGDFEGQQNIRLKDPTAMAQLKPASHKALTTGKWMMGLGAGALVLGLLVSASGEDNIGPGATLVGLGGASLGWGAITALVGYLIQDRGAVLYTSPY